MLNTYYYLDGEKFETAGECKGLKISSNPVVIKSLPDFELQFCENCIQMTNHVDNKCQKCKGNVL